MFIWGQQFKLLSGHTNEVKDVSWAVSGHLLATCGRDKSVWIWEFDDEEDFQCVSVLQSHSADVKSVFWHPIKELLGSTSYDNTINMYQEELDDWCLSCTLIGHDSTVWKAEFSPSGAYLASASEDRTIKIWTEMSNQKPIRWICLKTLSDAHTAAVLDLAWSTCGGYLATCSADDSICVFRSKLPPHEFTVTESYSVNMTLWQQIEKAHKGDVNSVSWHPRMSSLLKSSPSPTYILASGGDDRRITIWAISLDLDCVETLLTVKDSIDEFGID